MSGLREYHQYLGESRRNDVPPQPHGSRPAEASDAVREEVDLVGRDAIDVLWREAAEVVHKVAEAFDESIADACGQGPGVKARRAGLNGRCQWLR